MKSAVNRLLFLLLAIAVFLTARHLAKPPQLPAPTSPAISPTWDQLMIDSQKSLKDNNLDRAVMLCDQAMNIATEFSPGDTRYSKSEVQLAEIYCWQKSPDLAEKTFKKAIADCEKAAGPASTEMVFPLSALANFYTFVSIQPEQVTPILLRILNIVRNAPTHKDADIIMWSRNVGQSYQARSEYAQAEPYFKQAVDAAEKLDPNDWFPHELLTAADFYRAWGKYPQALTLANRALAIREKELGTSSDVDKKLDVTVCLDNLGQTDLASGNPREAEALYRRSLNIAESFMSPDQSDLSPRLAALATALRDEGKYAESASLYKRALSITEINTGPNSKESADIRAQYELLQKQK
jgi:tetratricopeptide (TPR) repeat protein